MAPPTRYQRGYSFSGFQATNPAKPLPGPALDAELENVELSIDGTISNLALLQRSDGALRNGIVTNDALAPDLQTGIAPAVPWSAGIQYVVGDVVFSYTAFYRCVVAHISTDFATDLAAGKWTVSADLTPIVTDAIAARDAAEAAAATATTQAGIATTGASTATTQAGAATAAAAAASDDADTAATQAGIATTGGSTATTQAGIATAAAAAAETARDEAVAATASKMDKLANLSDVSNVVTARSNLELGGAAVLNVGTTAGTVAAGNDTRIVGAVQRTGDTMTGALVVNTGLRLGHFNGSRQLDNPGDNSSARVLDLDCTGVTSLSATIRLFRNTNTTGSRSVAFCRGDGTSTVDNQINSGNSGTIADLARNGGNVLINGQTAWHNGNAGGFIDARNINPNIGITPTVSTGIYAQGDALGFSSHALTSAHTSNLTNKERFTAFIGNYDSGTGDGTVPASTYGLGVSVIKQNWQTTTRAGQTHGLSIVTRGGFHGTHVGDPSFNEGDSAAIVTNSLNSASQSYVAGGEGLVIFAKDGVYAFDAVDPVRQMRYYLPSIRPDDNPGIGHLVIAESGPLGAAYQAQNRIDLAIGAGSWSHFLRYIADFGDGFFEPFVVNQLGHATWDNGPGAGTPNQKKTIRVGDGGALEVVNSAGSSVIFSLSNGGSVTLPASQVLVIGSSQVVGPRQTGWTAPTGTPRLVGFDTEATNITEVARSLKSVIDLLVSHGLAGA